MHFSKAAGLKAGGWGRGILNMFTYCKEASLPEPEHGGRIDPKTGRLVVGDDAKNVTNDVTKKLTERQRVICEMLPVSDTDNVTKNEEITTAFLAKHFDRDIRTIKRDMKVLQKLGLVEHVGPSNGGYWKRLK